MVMSMYCDTPGLDDRLWPFLTVTLGKLLNHSGSQLPRLYTGNEIKDPTVLGHILQEADATMSYVGCALG